MHELICCAAQVSTYEPIKAPPEGLEYHAKQGRGWSVNYNKLHLWNLTHFEKVINFDHDAVVRENLDYVFTMPDAAACDCIGHDDGALESCKVGFRLQCCFR